MLNICNPAELFIREWCRGTSSYGRAAVHAFL